MSAIPGILRHDGSPPLFYLLLHVWIGVFGNSEAATHSFTVLLGLLTIPVGFWAARSLFGLRAGLYAAILFAVQRRTSPQYAQETRMYELMALLGILAVTGFLHGFVFGRRRYLILFSLSLAAMFYTHAWGLFFAAGSVVALIPVWLHSEDRRTARARRGRSSTAARPCCSSRGCRPSSTRRPTPATRGRRRRGWARRCSSPAT